MSANCRSCDAQIQWVVIAKSGKRMPLDVDKVRDGVRFAISSNTGMAYIEPDPQMPGYASHFSTCPNADQHRRPR